MPIPLILAAGAAVIGAVGLATQAQEDERKKLINDSFLFYNDALDSFHTQRSETLKELLNLGSLKINIYEKDMRSSMNLLLNVSGRNNFVGISENIDKRLLEKKNGREMGKYMDDILERIKSIEKIQKMDDRELLSACEINFPYKTFFIEGVLNSYDDAELAELSLKDSLDFGRVLECNKLTEEISVARDLYSKTCKIVEAIEMQKDALCDLQQISVQYVEWLGEFSKVFKRVILEVKEIYDRESKKWSETVGNKFRGVLRQEYKIYYNKLEQQQRELVNTMWVMTQVYYNIGKLPLISAGRINEKVATEIELGENAMEAFQQELTAYLEYKDAERIKEKERQEKEEESIKKEEEIYKREELRIKEEEGKRREEWLKEKCDHFEERAEVAEEERKRMEEESNQLKEKVSQLEEENQKLKMETQEEKEMEVD